ncbi:carbohydrate esterase family 3 protein [Thermothelomyces heterothallicus CBS 202.75]|uniref:carbohydrate esterase family 3 protein n=1 Tax=Thermothelomyces heterothallicus CBS 202.75 TaxID=1149848 RepID=UPI003743D1EC
MHLLALGFVTGLAATVLLGDSINAIACWRPLVWEQIAAAGLAGDVDLAYDIARNNIAGWVRSARPDVVQFMLGTNDVNVGKRDVQSVLDSYTIMLDAMRDANPNVKVIIDKLIPTRWSDATIEAINSAMPGWAATHSTAQSPVEVADCSRAAGFTNDMLQADGVHPNELGDRFVAEQAGPKLIQFISDARARVRH